MQRLSSGYRIANQPMPGGLRIQTEERKVLTTMIFPRRFSIGFSVCLLAISLSGCKSKLDKEIDQAKLDAAKTGQPQQVTSTDSKGDTVTTTVQPPIPGQSGQVVTTTVAPPVKPANGASSGMGNGMAGNAPNGMQQANMQQQAPAQPPPPIRVPAGTGLTIRIDQRISVKTSRAGDQFTGEIVDPVVDPANQVVIPKGSPVGGIVDYAHKRGHFKGASDLELRLTSLTLNGINYPLTTNDLNRAKKGKGRRSLAMIGGGAGLGMLIGGIATGGTGLLVGGLVGGGAGTAAAGLTGNGDIVIPAESIVHFRLADPLYVQQ